MATGIVGGMKNLLLPLATLALLAVSPVSASPASLIRVVNPDGSRLDNLHSIDLEFQDEGSAVKTVLVALQFNNSTKQQLLNAEHVETTEGPSFVGTVLLRSRVANCPILISEPSPCNPISTQKVIQTIPTEIVVLRVLPRWDVPVDLAGKEIRATIAKPAQGNAVDDLPHLTIGDHEYVSVKMVRSM